MEEHPPGGNRSRRGRGARAGSRAEPTAPHPLLFQPPSPSPSAEPPIADDSPPAHETPTSRAAAATPAKKTAGKKTAGKKTVAKKGTGQRGANQEAPAKKTPAKKGATATPAKAAKAAPAPRKKAASRTAPVPKQPGPDPGHAELAHVVPPPAERPAPVREEPPLAEAAPSHASISDPRQILVRLLGDPAHAPELLAAAAVRLIGPRAAAWADAMQSAYPTATAEGLTRLATRRFVRLAAAGGLVSAGAGLFAPAAELVTAALTRAGLVLHIAAAHGHDPGDPARAVELLVLSQVHIDEDAARAALTAATEAHERPGQEAAPIGRAAAAGLRLAVPLAADTGGWVFLRLASRVVPAARVIAATAGQAAATERLATRSAAYYRRARAS
jgi:hypothetical protein